MKHIKWGLWGFLAGTTALWLLADTFWPQPFTYFSFRNVFVQYSGVLAMGSMSLCMVLAVRPAWLENWLNGLDKGYRLHKWLGIAALVTSVAHFWFAKGTKWMARWGWITRPARRGAPPASAADGVQTLEQWLRGFRDVAEGVGEWVFYIALVLMIAALIKRIPYRWFVKFHKWLAVGYLALVFHGVVLIKFAYWKQPVGWLMAVLMAAGSVSALLILLKRTGITRCSTATVVSVTRYPQMDGYDLVLHAPAWGGHQAGQFAFVRNLGDKESPHPFTIASAWDASNHQLRLLIKNLGDYTCQLAEHFKAGDQVRIEGPYGRFTFADDAPAQIWVAAGIGITPFMARLEELARAEQQGQRHSPQTSPQTIDLFYCYRDMEQELLTQLQHHAQAAQVHLHLWHTATQGRLTGEHVRNQVANWKQASVWFCGVSAFGEALQRDLRAHGLPAERFHQELFEMR